MKSKLKSFFSFLLISRANILKSWFTNYSLSTLSALDSTTITIIYFNTSVPSEAHLAIPRGRSEIFWVCSLLPVISIPTQYTAGHASTLVTTRSSVWVIGPEFCLCYLEGLNLDKLTSPKPPPPLNGNRSSQVVTLNEMIQNATLAQ